MSIAGNSLPLCLLLQPALQPCLLLLLTKVEEGQHPDTVQTLQAIKQEKRDLTHKTKGVTVQTRSQGQGKEVRILTDQEKEVRIIKGLKVDQKVNSVQETAVLDLLTLGIVTRVLTPCPLSIGKFRNILPSAAAAKETQRKRRSRRFIN